MAIGLSFLRQIKTDFCSKPDITSMTAMTSLAGLKRNGPRQFFRGPKSEANCDIALTEAVVLVAEWRAAGGSDVSQQVSWRSQIYASGDHFRFNLGKAINDTSPFL